jgi:hypothetical protein
VAHTLESSAHCRRLFRDGHREGDFFKVWVQLLKRGAEVCVGIVERCAGGTGDRLQLSQGSVSGLVPGQAVQDRTGNSPRVIVHWLILQ